MESNLSSIDTLAEPPCIIDPATEVKEFVEEEINSHREEIFGLLEKVNLRYFLKVVFLRNKYEKTKGKKGGKHFDETILALSDV